MKRLCITFLVCLISISVLGQDAPCYCVSHNGKYSFTVMWDGPDIQSDRLIEGYAIEWDDIFPQEEIITRNVYWKVWREHDGYQYNDLSEFDNKPYVQVDVDGWGTYNFHIYNSETNEVIRSKSLTLTRSYFKHIDLSNDQDPISIPISGLSEDDLTSFNVSKDSIYISIQNHKTWDLQSGNIKQIHDITFVEQFYGSGSGIDFSTSLYGSLRLEGDEMDNPISYSFYIGDFAMINDIKKIDDKTFIIRGFAYQDNSSDENKINGEFFTPINLSLTILETEKVLLYLKEDYVW